MPAPDHEQAFLDALESVGVAKPGGADATTVPGVEVEQTEVGTATVAPPPAVVTSSNIWRHPDAHPIVLDLLLLRQYGPEWLAWEPETLQLLIPEDFHTQALSDLNLSKIQACKVLHLVDSFWQRWEIFIACAMPFNGEFPDFQVMQVPTVAQVLVACDVAARIRDDVEWSSEVKAYIATVYAHDGIWLPLPPADFVSLEVPEELDLKVLAQRWAEVRVNRHVPAGQTELEEQLRRLLIASDYLEESRTRLAQQLRATHA